jgi:hypothetical protein
MAHPVAETAQPPPSGSRAIPELHYRVAAAASGMFPGHHRSRSGDSGFEFRGHAPLQDAPDVRRLDLHASLRDPFGGWIVRQYSQRQSIPVAMVADLSASMGFVGAQRKLDVLADFVESLAWSTWRTGDSFGFVGCDEAIRPEWVVPATRHRGAGATLAQTLRASSLNGRSAAALRQAHRYLPRRTGLVFLVSDFHLPLDEVEAVLDSLLPHEVVPVVLWQPAEFDLGDRRGLAIAQEPESGTRRWLWWRPVLRERWQAARRQRHDALQQVFHARRLPALFIEGGFDADAVTRHFLA